MVVNGITVNKQIRIVLRLNISDSFVRDGRRASIAAVRECGFPVAWGADQKTFKKAHTKHIVRPLSTGNIVRGSEPLKGR